MYPASLPTDEGQSYGQSPLGISNASNSACRSLLEKQQPVLGDTMFGEDLFNETCEAIRNRNEARVT